MKMKQRVFVAMSGGVDSSVAAAMLLEEGYEVIGITMRVWSGDEPESDAPRQCCSESAARDATEVAARLSIKHYVVNYLEPFHNFVIQDFVATYLRGETPNPCIRCNRYVKFGQLLEEAVALEADYLASGHYAGIQRDESSGRYLLMKGADEQKDQSYTLYLLTQGQLSKLMFPLGNQRKEETRRIAQELGLGVAHKRDSQEICFIPDGDYGSFLKKHVRETFEPGPILALDGREIGEHRGLPLYTVGQRKGLGIPAGEPLYVVRLDTTRNAVIVGPDSAVWGKEFQARDVNWIAFSHAPEETRAKVKIRYLHKEQDATVHAIDERTVQVRFDAPQRAITPGQAAVFYDDDTVLGGGTITSTSE
jgi:tRNA-specific 2-thiouridylase